MNNEELINLILGASIIIILLVIVLLIPVLIAKWKLFKKAGKNGWEIFIPFYSTWVLIEIAGLNWWYFLIAIAGSILSFLGIEGLGWLTTIASYLISFLVYYNIAKKMKQNEILYGILGIFVPIVPLLILGFSKNISPYIPVRKRDGRFGKNPENFLRKFLLSLIYIGKMSTPAFTYPSGQKCGKWPKKL